MPFVVLSLRPIFCSVDTSLRSLISDINWCSHLFQYSRLLLCCLTRPFQAVTYSLRKNSFNSHEVYLKVFVVTSLTLVIVESRARGFRVLRYLRWRNGKLPKLRLLPATLASLARSASSAVSSAGGSLTIHWACTNLWTSEWTFYNFFVDCPWSKTAGVGRYPLSGQGRHRQLYFYFWTPGSVLFGLNLSFAPCWKRRNTTKAETDATSIQHPKCWASLEQSEDIIDYLFRKMNWEWGTSWEKLCSTNYLQGQIYKRFVRSSGNIVLIILVAFFKCVQ